MIKQQSLSPAAWAGIFLMALIWGASFLATRVALDEVPFHTFVAFRIGGAAVLVWVWLLITRQPLPREPRSWAALAVMGMLGNVLPFLLIAWGQLHIASGLTSILNASTAIFSVLVAAIFLADEKLTFRKALGVLTGFAGVATAIGLQNLSSLDLTSLAQLAIVGATLCYGLANTWARVFLKGVPNTVSVAGMLGFATLVVVPLALVKDGAPSWDYSAATWAALGYSAFVATAAAYLIFYRVLKSAGAGNAGLTTLLVAPVAIVLGVVVLDESLRPAAYIGFALLAVGLLILDGRLYDRLFRPDRLAPPGPDR